MTVAFIISTVIATLAAAGFYRRGGQLDDAITAAASSKIAMTIAVNQRDAAVLKAEALQPVINGLTAARTADAKLADAREGQLAAQLAQARKDRDALAVLSPSAAGAGLDSVLQGVDPRPPSGLSGAAPSPAALQGSLGTKA